MNLTHENIRFVPCAHRRVGFAEAVRAAALEFKPDLIAVELPATLELLIRRGIARLPRISVVCWNEPRSENELCWLPIDPCDALIEAVRLGVENGIDVRLIDLDVAGHHQAYQPLPDDRVVHEVGLENFVEACEPYLRSDPNDPVARAREHHMATRLAALSGACERVLCVIGLAHLRPVMGLLAGDQHETPPTDGVTVVRGRPDAELADPSMRSLAEVLGEIPRLTWHFEQHRENLELLGETRFDPLDVLTRICRKAAVRYTETYKERINLTQWTALFQFTRNLAIVQGRLRPELYELVLGARGIVDGDYGHELYELARSYPPQKGRPADGLPRLKMHEGRGMLEGHEERFRMKAQWESPPAETVQLRFRRRPSHALKMKWKDQWNRTLRMGICSWPPEDEVQERFMDFVRKRALQRMTEDRKQVHEFTTSLLDGLDLRETTRNWHTGKLYVQSTPQPRGRIGAAVLILDDEPIEGGRYTWRTTLFAEHQNESDIAFYASPLGEHVVGPRISRTEFGGLLSVYPAWGIPDIWRFQMGEGFRHCSDVLTAAAILFSPYRFIALVSDRPPRPALRQMAASANRHIIHMPLRSFSRGQIRRIRRFHILDGHDVRRWAADYIFED